jgi:hypothetical protein
MSCKKFAHEWGPYTVEISNIRTYTRIGPLMVRDGIIHALTVLLVAGIIAIIVLEIAH